MQEWDYVGQGNSHSPVEWKYMHARLHSMLQGDPHLNIYESNENKFFIYLECTIHIFYDEFMIMFGMVLLC